MKKNFATTANATAMSKLLALQNALADCGIPSTIVDVDTDGSVCLSAPLWDCEDGSGKILEVYALEVEGFEIGSAVSTSSLDYDELLEDYDILTEDYEEE